MTNRLALLGGTPAVTAEHGPVCDWPRLDDADEQAVLRVLRDGNISTHPVTRELEHDYAQLTGRNHALAHNNGTAALLAAFFALNLEPGDEVLVPTATFWASVLPMCWLGLVPVFCNSEADRLGIDPADMEQKISDRTRAVVVVHLWGMPAKMTEILALAKRHQLKIIEDASHTHGARWRDRPCGSLGDISVFSLQGDKLAPAGEGGVLLCDDYAYYERAVCLGDITRIFELQTAARRFAATSFGIKTRMAPLSAALARSQLAKLTAHNAQRNRNHGHLSQALEALGFETFLPPAHVHRVYFEFIVRHQDARFPLELVVRALQAEGCRVTLPRYPLVHQQPFFSEGHCAQLARICAMPDHPGYRAVGLERTAEGARTLLRLPNFPGPDNGLLSQYITAFEKVMEQKEALLSAADEVGS
jgi:dTDP-4-amino-4,6-dideoxygalactose transaminase